MFAYGKWGIRLLIKTKTSLHDFAIGFYPNGKIMKFYINQSKGHTLNV